jgi:probable blue pigment (indigoidine) exporter
VSTSAESEPAASPPVASLSAQPRPAGPGPAAGTPVAGTRLVGTSIIGTNIVGTRIVGTRAEGIVLVLFTACSWGLTWPQSKFLLTMLPPFSMRASCGVLGFCFAFLVAFARRERIWPPRDQWPRLVLFGLLNYGQFMVLTTASLVWLKASEAVVITYTLPVWAALLAWPMLGERPTFQRILALILALGGVALLVGADSAEATWHKLPAAGMSLAAAILFALGTVLAKKKPLRLPPATSVAWQAMIGMTLVLSLASFEHPDWGKVTAGGWVSIAFISTIPLTVAYLAWFRALRLVPASTAATTVLLSPVVGVIGSGILLGETFGPRQIVALVLTLTGVALAARG